MISRTFRCWCGQTNRIPKSQADFNRSCPNCGRPLRDLCDTKKNDERIRAEIKESTKHVYFYKTWKYPRFIWIAICFVIVTQRPASVAVIGRDEKWALWWLGGWMLANYAISIMSLIYVNFVYMVFSRKQYVEDRVAYAKAGCFDIAMWAPVIAFIVTYSVYWATLKFTSPDIIKNYREPGKFVIVYFCGTVACMFGALAAFRFYNMLNKKSF